MADEVAALASAPASFASLSTLAATLATLAALATAFAAFRGCSVNFSTAFGSEVALLAAEVADFVDVRAVADPVIVAPTAVAFGIAVAVSRDVADL